MGGTELLSRPYDIHILMNIHVCRHGCAHKIHEHKHKHMVYISHGVITIPFNIKQPMWIHMQAEHISIHVFTCKPRISTHMYLHHTNIFTHCIYMY